MGDRQAFPLYPLDSLTPFLTRAAALDPGLGAEVFPRQKRGRKAAAATIPHAALGEGSKRKVVVLKERTSKRGLGPAGALRACPRPWGFVGWEVSLLALP